MGTGPLTRPALIVLDFDGTISEQDVLDWMTTRYAPEHSQAAEAALAAGEISLNECIRREFAPIRGDHETLVAEAVEAVHVRRGFARFVREAEAAGHRVVVVSSGFHAVIGPVLEREGVGHLETIANDALFSPQGTRVTFVDAPLCELCGETCKRGVVEALDGDAPVVYVGDGYSDRCASRAAAERFARHSLARWLDREGLDYTRYDDFDVIREALL